MCAATQRGTQKTDHMWPVFCLAYSTLKNAFPARRNRMLCRFSNTAAPNSPRHSIRFRPSGFFRQAEPLQTRFSGQIFIPWQSQKLDELIIRCQFPEECLSQIQLFE